MVLIHEYIYNSKGRQHLSLSLEHIMHVILALLISELERKIIVKLEECKYIYPLYDKEFDHKIQK